MQTAAVALTNVLRHPLRFLQSKSARMNRLQTLTGCAMLCALYVALQMVTINLSPTLQINFSFLALAVSCALYGFWPNMVFAFAADFLGFMMHPDGAYVPLFALILMVKAAIYTFFLYGNGKISITRLLLAQLAVDVLCNILLNPLLLAMMYHMPYWVLVGARLAKNAIMYPIECVLLYLVSRIVARIPAAVSAQSQNR